MRAVAAVFALLAVGAAVASVLLDMVVFESTSTTTVSGQTDSRSTKSNANIWKSCVESSSSRTCAATAPASCTAFSTNTDVCSDFDSENCLWNYIIGLRATTIGAGFFALLGIPLAIAAPGVGILMCALGLLFNLATVALFAYIWYLDCDGTKFSDTEGYEIGLMPFMGGAGMLFSCIAMIVGAVAKRQADAAAAEAEADGDGAEPKEGTTEPYGDSATRGAEGGDASSSKKAADEPAPKCPVEGDWKWVAGEQMWWSDTEQLFLSRENNHYLDPHSAQWYNPETGDWYEKKDYVAPAAPEKGGGASKKPDPFALTPGGQHATDEALRHDPGDFAMDAESGMLWSDKQNVYLDEGSGMKYCSDRGKWFDPQSGEWQ